jgi:alkaline phosphatase D
MRSFTILIAFLCLPAADFFAQPQLLQSGPMVGYVAHKEALLWVQTTQAASVQFSYWDNDLPARTYITESVTTKKEDAFTAKLIADSIAPGHTYSYELFINNVKIPRPYPTHFTTPPHWEFHTEPPNFTIAFGSCAYFNDSVNYDRKGAPYGGGYEIFPSIAAKNPSAMVWLGDNIYLEESDWDSQTGINFRYTKGRSTPELQSLLGSTSNYAIWDDHDFGPNDCDRSFPNRYETLKGFKRFWGNPYYGRNGKEGITTTFSWGDADFFLLDDRWWRSPDHRKTGERTMLGKDQFEWLIDALVTSTARFKIIAIGGQVLNPFSKFEDYSMFPAEREKLINTITEEQIRGVIFVSGDRHFGELSKLERYGTYPLYDLTTSPLTSGPVPNAHEEPNFLRVPGTIAEERNFATIEFSGPAANRMLTMKMFGTKGQELWKKEFKASELQ